MFRSRADDWSTRGTGFSPSLCTFPLECAIVPKNWQHKLAATCCFFTSANDMIEPMHDVVAKRCENQNPQIQPLQSDLASKARLCTAPNSFWNVARLLICAAFRHFKWYLSSLLLLQFWICTFFCRRYSRRKWHLIDRVSCLYLLVKSVKNCIFAILNSINSISIRFYSLWIEVTILLVSQHSRQRLSRQWNDAVFTPRLCLAV